MVFDALTQQIDDARLRLSRPLQFEGIPLQSALSGDYGMQIRIAAHKHVRELAKQLEEHVARIPGVTGRSGHMLNTPGNGGPFTPEQIAPALLLHAIDVGSAERALEDLERLCASEKAECTIVQALLGVSVSHGFSLTPDVKLVPIEDVPSSAHKHSATSPDLAGTGTALLGTLRWEQPKAALLSARTFAPFWNPDSGKPEPTGIIFGDPIMREIALALTLAGPSPSFPLAQWVTFSDPLLERLSPSGRMSHPPELLPLTLDNTSDLDQVRASAAVTAFLSTTHEVRTLLTVATQRLNQAMLRRAIGDKAVEISVALEALMGDGGNTEMTHKIRTRCARFLGGTPERRGRVYEVLTKTYAIRSKLVHQGVHETGPQKVGGEKVEARALLGEACQITADLILQLSERGVPDWKAFDILADPYKASLDDVVQDVKGSTSQGE